MLPAPAPPLPPPRILEDFNESRPLPVPLIVLLPVVIPGDDPTVLDPGLLLGSEPAVRVELSPVKDIYIQ